MTTFFSNLESNHFDDSSTKSRQKVFCVTEISTIIYQSFPQFEQMKHSFHRGTKIVISGIF